MATLFTSLASNGEYVRSTSTVKSRKILNLNYKPKSVNILSGSILTFDLTMAFRRPARTSLGVLLLATQVYNYGLDRIPPATLTLLVAQSAIYLDMLKNYFPSANSVCISSYLVFYQHDWKRLVLGALYHGSDMHLYYNMVSLLFKGSFLEKRLGTAYFVYLISVFTLLSGGIYVGLGFLLARCLEDDSYLTTCAVGFSGVLFALKVLSTHYSPDGTQYVLGILPVPSKHVYWAELLVIQVLVPNASFVGHLAGILVGVAYIWGPLKFIMDIFLLPTGSRPASRPRTSQPTFYDYSGRATRYSSSSSDDRSSYTTTTTGTGSSASYRYSDQLSEDEQLQRAVEESLRNSGSQPNLADLRTRRTQYYQ